MRPLQNVVKCLFFHPNVPNGHPNIEVFLSRIKHESLKEVQSPLAYSNFSKEKWKAVSSLANVCNIVIKKVDKDYCVAIWNRSDYNGSRKTT